MRHVWIAPARLPAEQLVRNSLQRRSLLLAMLSGLMPTRGAHAQAAEPLEIGVLPNISARVLLAQYQAMRVYLAREMKRPVQVSTAPNWSAFQQRTLGLEYDVVVTAANMARVAQMDRGFVPLLSYAPDIQAMLVCALQRPIRTVAELRGQTLTIANPQSLVAMRGMQWLHDNGLRRDKDFQIIITPTDDSVGSVVVRGDAMAAILSGGEYLAIPESIKSRLQVVSVFAEVPGFMVMASPLLPAADAQAIKQHLLQFATRSDEGRAFFDGSGFTAMREPLVAHMESMDPFLETTRRLLLPQK